MIDGTGGSPILGLRLDNLTAVYFHQIEMALDGAIANPPLFADRMLRSAEGNESLRRPDPMLANVDTAPDAPLGSIIAGPVLTFHKEGFGLRKSDCLPRRGGKIPPGAKPG